MPQKYENAKKVLSRWELHEVPKRENFGFSRFAFFNFTTRKIDAYHIKSYKLN